MSTIVPIKIADSKIVEWRFKDGKFAVFLINWREEPLRINFRGTAAVAACSTEGVDISHIESCDDDPLLNQVRARGEDAADLAAYRFINSWDETVALTVVASACEMDEQRLP